MPIATASSASRRSEKPPLGLRARKQHWTRDAIWDAAIALFTEKGFDAVTIEEIADAARVSRRSFFRYFESKDDLMARPIAGMTTALAEAVDSCPAGASPGQLLRHVVSALAQGSAADTRTAPVMKIARRDAAAREAMTSRLFGAHDQIQAAFARRHRDPVLVQVLSAMTLTALSAGSRHWFTSGRGNIATSVDKVLAGMAEVASGLDEGTR